MIEKYPSKDECMKLLRDYGTPPHVVGHCKAVAEVAVAVGKKLNEKGFNLDLDLVAAAGLTHDIARVKDKHWEVAAKYLRELGYQSVADIVEVHMFYPQFSSADKTTETDLVCLGDRTVKEDQYVGVEERMAYIIAKADRYSGDEKEEVIKKILVKKQQLIEYIEDLEEIMGLTLDELMAQQ